ncbi:MAG: Uma2 family endonuclease [Peptococcaceae bacterium]|nr:Uma2 family endonuclease [Peptococcaceae bacterium]
MEALQNDDKHYTWADYIAWDEKIRCELIDGMLYMMTAPSVMHQNICGSLFYQLFDFLKGKPCKVFIAPFDVRLDIDKGDDTVVQPDILVVCDKEKLDQKGCLGAPDLVVEILSPSSGTLDKVLKFNKYLQAGVREYWIVDPDSKAVNVYVLENGKYVASAYSEEDSMPSHVLEGCTITLADVFAE